MSHTPNEPHPSDVILRKVNREIARRQSAAPPVPKHHELGYRVGDDLRFGEASSEEIRRLVNFSHAETTHVWTLGAHASFELRLAQPLLRPHLLRLNLVPFVSPGRQAQQVDLSINGTLIAKWIVTYEGPYFGLLTPDLGTPSHALRFDLYTPDALSPRAAGVSGDERTLGIALRSLRISSFSDSL